MECALLTDAAEAFLAQADEHIEAEVAVGRTVKVLEPPQMVAVLFDILSQNQNGDWDHVIGCLEPRERERAESYRVESEEDEERDGRHTTAFPLFQRDGAVIVVINFRHHLLQDLRAKRQHSSYTNRRTDGRTDALFTHRFQLGCVPAEVFGYGHHLIHNAIHFLV